MSAELLDVRRPYLVVPKLIEQPTWGGFYIADTKQWGNKKALVGRKIGQSYELFSGSNLSLLDSSEDSLFEGELTSPDTVARLTDLPNTVPLGLLINSSPEEALGKERVSTKGSELNLLVKFTQALGNSFQLHIKDGMNHPYWKPKPESWYYFEPGLVTLGARPGVDWERYRFVVTTVGDEMAVLGSQVASQEKTHKQAQEDIRRLIDEHNPWDFVNLYEIEKDQLIDLSGGGVHHSWEEDSEKFPLGNVLYELQAEAMDDISTIRNFDKGKMAKDGSTRKIHIDDYFSIIDRDPEVNDPRSHIREAKAIANTDDYTLEELMSTKYYTLRKLVFPRANGRYDETIAEYRHIFVRFGAITVSTTSGSLHVTSGHSCFVPGGAQQYSIQNLDDSTELLISFN